MVVAVLGFVGIVIIGRIRCSEFIKSDRIGIVLNITKSFAGLIVGILVLLILFIFGFSLTFPLVEI
jgi:hypothetical protein